MKNPLPAIKQAALNTCIFFGLVDDHDRRWNWTTTTLILVLVGLPFGILPPGLDLVALLLALLARAHKKVLGNKVNASHELSAQVEGLKAQVSDFIEKGVAATDALTAQMKRNTEVNDAQSKVLAEVGSTVERLQAQVNPAPGVGFTPFR